MPAANQYDLSLGGDYSMQLGKLIWGDRDEKEKFVQQYGYEHSLGAIDSAIKSIKPSGDNDTNYQNWYDDIMDFKKDLLSRQTS